MILGLRIVKASIVLFIDLRFIFLDGSLLKSSTNSLLPR